ncbi:MAG: hypothetical protein ACMXYM_03610 [Candidatus Woesearchaeota archaeon]
MIRFVLIVALVALLASCAAERDIEAFKVSIEPTGLGFACVIDGDAPDSWGVTAFSGEEEVDIAFTESSSERVEFEHQPGLTRVECAAYYEEGVRSAFLSLR